MAETGTAKVASTRHDEQDSSQSSNEGIDSETQVVDKLQHQGQDNENKKNIIGQTVKETQNYKIQTLVQQIVVSQVATGTIHQQINSQNVTDQTLFLQNVPFLIPVNNTGLGKLGSVLLPTVGANQNKGINTVFYQCGLCNLAVQSLEALQKHMTQLHHDSLHPCTECGMYFINETFLAKHTCMSKNTKKRYKCQYCPLEYKAEGKLHNHLRLYHPEGRKETIYVCKVCKQQFDVELHLVEHMKIHVTLSPFQCGLCGMLFEQGRSLTTHRFAQHSVEQVANLDPQQYGHPYKCAICGKGFLCSDTLGLHVQRHTGKYSFKCNICPRGFSNNRALQSHVRQHAKKRPFKCKICGKGLSKRHVLVAHMRQHDKTRKTFKCHMCHREFAFMCNLDRHIIEAHNSQSVPPVFKTGANPVQTHRAIMARLNDKNISQINISQVDIPKLDSILSEIDGNEKGSLQMQSETATDSVSDSACISHTNFSETNTDSRSSIAHLPITKPVMLYKCSACKKRFDDRKECESHLETHNTVTESVSDQNMKRRNHVDITKSYRMESSEMTGYGDTVDSPKDLSGSEPRDCAVTEKKGPDDKSTNCDMVQDTTQLLDKSTESSSQNVGSKEAKLSEVVDHDYYNGSALNLKEKENANHEHWEREQLNNSDYVSEWDVDDIGDVSEDCGASVTGESLNMLDDLMMMVSEEKSDTLEVTMQTISETTSKVNEIGQSQERMAIDNVDSEGSHAESNATIDEVEQVSLLNKARVRVKTEKKKSAPAKQERKGTHNLSQCVKLCRTITTLNIPCKFSRDPSKKDVQETLTLYQCSDCKIRFFDESACEEHIEDKHPKAVKCLLCRTSFDNQNEHSIHISTSHFDLLHEGPVICPKPSGAINISQLPATFSHAQPTLTGRSWQPFQGNTIGPFHGSITEPLSKPQKSKFEEILRKMYPMCGVCGETFSDDMFVDEGAFRKHLLSHSYTGDWPPKCDVCGETFKKEINLQWHMYKHNNEWPHKCDQCDKGFTVPSKLERHMDVHTKAKRHKCSVCDRVFGQKPDLKKHMMRHTGVRPFQCHICGKAFMLKFQMKQHILQVHTSDAMKPYQCEVCNKGFVEKWLLRSHMMQHTGDAPSYLCDECGVSFKSKHGHASHLKRRHQTSSTGAVEAKTTPSGVTFYPCHVCLDAFRTASGLIKHKRMCHVNNDHTQD